MKLALVKTLTNVGLSIFNYGCNLADKWGLDKDIWVEFDDDEDEPENPFDDLTGLDPDEGLPKEA